MSTRSIIAAKLSDGTYKSIYCHSDGYPEHVGRLLMEHYTDPTAIEALMALGDLSSLGESVECPAGNSYSNRARGCCVAYGRDRGETGVEAKTGETRESVSRDAGQDFDYLWDGNRWLVDGKPLTRVMCGLPLVKTGNVVLDALQAAEAFIAETSDGEQEDLLAQVREAIQQAGA